MQVHLQVSLFILAFAGAMAMAAPQIAVVGDSGVTGAASSPDIEPTVANLLGQVWGALAHTPHTTSVTRVPYASAEAPHFWNRWWLDLGARFSRQLDVPENSFALQVATHLGVAPQDVVLVGQDGAQVSSLGQQFARIFAVPGTTHLPPLVFVSFTANDFCDSRVFEGSLERHVEEFKAHLAKGWAEAAPYLLPHPSGTRILVLAPFDVVGVITNPEILSQKIEVEGQGEITCGQLRHGQTKATAGSFFVLRLLNLMCPSVTQTHLKDAARLQRLREIQDGFSKAWKEQLAQLRERYPAIRWEYLEDVRSIAFVQGDVANDCFHPSQRGHQKTAALILSRGFTSH